MSFSSRLFTSNAFVALSAAGIVLVAVACSGASTPSSPETGGEVDTSQTIPARANPPSNGSSSSSTSSSSDSGSTATSDASSSTDAALSEAGSVKDAAADAKVDSGPQKLPYGSTCTTHDQCAGNLCLAFDGKLRCTKTCKSDDDCQNGDDCDGDVKVCEID